MYECFDVHILCSCVCVSVVSVSRCVCVCVCVCVHVCCVCVNMSKAFVSAQGMRTSRVIHMNESCHTHIDMNESCPSCE